MAGKAAIEKIENDPGWFRRPIGKGRIVPLAEVVAEAAGGGREEEGGGGEKVLVCVKTVSSVIIIINFICALMHSSILYHHHSPQIHPVQAIRTRRGPSHRRAIVVFDDSAADVELTLWGEHVLMADAWTALQTGRLWAALGKKELGKDRAMVSVIEQFTLASPDIHEGFGSAPHHQRAG